MRTLIRVVIYAKDAKEGFKVSFLAEMYYKVGNATIWACYDCGELFDSEICRGFTGQCYSCYPRLDEMRGDLTDYLDHKKRLERGETK